MTGALFRYRVESRWDYSIRVWRVETVCKYVSLSLSLICVMNQVEIEICVGTERMLDRTLYDACTRLIVIIYKKGKMLLLEQFLT